MSAAAVPIAFGLDAMTGEPPRLVHPVAWFGRAVAGIDRDWTHPRAVGVVVAVLAPFLATVVVGTIVATSAVVATPAAVVATALVLYVTTSRRMLVERSRSIVHASEEDVERARGALPALVGRDVDALSPAQVRSAAVESAAENLADGVVAPLLAFAGGAVVGGTFGPPAALALGAAAATWIKAVNTLDSMVGYPDRSFGWASARLDDIAMWIPARVSAVLIAVVATRPSALIEARRWLPSVASPNAGWPMGTLAAVADCRLEKPDAYVLNAAAPLPAVETSLGAIRTVDRAALLAYALATLLAALEVLAWS